MEHADVAPADCPTPGYHATHYYCPSCTFIADDAPVSEVEAQRSRADSLHVQLGETLAALAERDAEIERMKAACHHSSQTMEGEGVLRCELCGAVERDPFWRNPA